jgi:WD40 repeat protein
MFVGLVAGLSLLSSAQSAAPKGEASIPTERVIAPEAGPIRAIDLSHDGARLLVGCESGRLFLFELESGVLLEEFETGLGMVNDVQFDTLGEQFLTVQLLGASLWDARTFELRQRWGAQRNGMAAGRISPDGTRVATCAFGSGLDAQEETSTRLWNSASGELLATFGGTGIHIDLAFRPDGKALLISSGGIDEAFVHALDDLARGPRVLKGHSGGIAASAWSPDGRTVLTASVDLSARLWSADNGRKLQTLRGHTGYLVACGFSPDGKEASTTSWVDRTTRIWTVKSGKQRLELAGHEAMPTQARFAPDGRSFATADQLGVGLLHELDKGLRIGRLAGHVGSVSGLEFTPDARWIVTAGHDGTVRVWANPPAE